MKIAVTGHRPDKLFGGYDHEKNFIIKEEMIKYLEYVLSTLDENEELICYSGMAIGIDQLFADAVLTVRNEHENVRLICALPFENQYVRWSQDAQAMFHAITEHADETVNVSGEQNYKPYFMQLRNQYMVDNCDVLLAYFNGSEGGTKNCYNYAKEKNKQVVVSTTGLIK